MKLKTRQRSDEEYPEETDIREFMRRLSGSEVYYAPNPGNAGDSAIALATYNLFESLNIDYNVVDWSDSFDSRGEVVIYGGGGNLTSKYEQAKSFIREHHQSARRLILLPHTVQGNTDILSKVGENVDLFCREYRSYRWVQEKTNNARVHLADDMAFMLTPDSILGHKGVSSGVQGLHIIEQIYRSVSSRIWGRSSESVRVRKAIGEGGAALLKLISSALGDRKLSAIRTDEEKVAGAVPTGNVDISSVYEYGVSPKETAQKATKLVLAYIKRFDKIITNRLHICILSALLKKNVQFFDNNYYKNREVYKFSIKDRYDCVDWCHKNDKKGTTYYE